jgi:SAM-dependent methyltransferase
MTLLDEQAVEETDLDEVLAVNRAAYDRLVDHYRGTAHRRNKSAPRWFASLLDLAEKPEPRPRLLELGSADGTFTRFFTDHGYDVTAVELADSMADATKSCAPAARVVRADFLSHDFGDERFDVIVAMAFVHLFPTRHAPRVMAKIHSLLKPGGIAYFTTTNEEKNDEGYEVKHGTGPDVPHAIRYRSRYTAQSFVELVCDSGFDPSTDPYEADDVLVPGRQWVNVVARRALARTGDQTSRPRHAGADLVQAPA